jgi:capsular polysaccharide biosynthesis protein
VNTNVAGGTHNQTQSLRDYLRIFFRHKLLIVAVVVLFSSIVFVAVSFYTPLYSASVKMLIEGRQETAAEYYEAYRYISKSLYEGEIIKSNPVIRRVVLAVKLYTRPLDYEKFYASKLKRKWIQFKTAKLMKELRKLPDKQRQEWLINSAVAQLKANISVEQIKDTSMFKLIVDDIDPRTAVLLANSVSRSYLIFELERQMAEIELKYGSKYSVVKQLQEKISELKKNLDGKVLPTMEAIGPARVKIIEQAESASIDKKYNRKLILVLGITVGIILALMLAFILDYMDQTIKATHDIEKYLGVPAIGFLPRVKGRSLLVNFSEEKRSKYVMTYENLIENLANLTSEHKIKSILLSDFETGSSVHTVALNVASGLGEKNRDKKILVVDANLIEPGLNRLLNVQSGDGLNDVVGGRIPFENALLKIRDNVFAVITGNSNGNISSLINSVGMVELFNMLHEVFDYIIVAGTDVKHFPFFVKFASFTDGTVLLINDGKVKRLVAMHDVELMKQHKIKLLGAILNNRNLNIPEFLYNRA